jgi:cystathionine beta-synthase
LNSKDAGVSYIVEGIGYDFVPEVLSRIDGDIDEWVKTSDVESFAAARLLHRQEGLLCGGSCGAALAGAFSWLEKSESGRRIAQTPGANVVVVLPDGIRNYMSKPWFLEMTMQAEPTALAAQIKTILEPTDSHLAEKSGEQVAGEIEKSMKEHM